MDVWVGSETGLLKGVSVQRKQAVNFSLSSSGRLSRDQEVRCLCWYGPVEAQILVGAVDGIVRTFDVDKGAVTSTQRCGEPADGCFTGLGTLGSSLITCTEKGTVRVWDQEKDQPRTELRAGDQVHRMRVNPFLPHTVATGGRENPLKIWDLEKPLKPVFCAKNLRDTWLDLRQPHWIRDLVFTPKGQVLTCTAYHQVHLYDPLTPRRRPVLETVFGEAPLTALCLFDHTVAVASAQGQVALMDLRKLQVCGALRGVTGSVRSLTQHPSLPLIASCSLDRHLRIHSLTDRRLQHKVYLKSRLNCLLMSSSDPNAAASPLRVKEEEEEDEVWDCMESVHERGVQDEGAQEESAQDEGAQDGERPTLEDSNVVKDINVHVKDDGAHKDMHEAESAHKATAKPKRRTNSKKEQKPKRRKKGQD
ncbi:unnamed protein product [Knipowitschia caucasica]|uniref:WD repeat domain 74 n=1 Tax=Knipowitschia caucasica TaxID=637954 RepID=A0AAV2J1C8_KNICA